MGDSGGELMAWICVFGFIGAIIAFVNIYSYWKEKRMCCSGTQNKTDNQEKKRPVWKIYVKTLFIFLTPFILTLDVIFRHAHLRQYDDYSLSRFWEKATNLEILAWSFVVLVSYLLITFLWRIAVAVEKPREDQLPKDKE